MIITCPQCHKETSRAEHAEYPFCSSRCKNVDFIHWSEEKHKISTSIEDADEFKSLDSGEGDGGF